MRVLFISLLLFGSACALKNIMKMSCDNTFSMFGDNSFMGSSMRLPAFSSKVLQYMDDTMGQFVQKACPNAKAEQLQTLGFRFGDFPGLMLQMMDKSAPTPYSVIKELGCLGNGLEILNSFGFFNLPDTCNYKTWTTTGKCKFMIDFGTVIPGITFVANIAKCPSSKVPQMALECEGPNCEDLFKPCSVDADCSGKCEQFVTDSADRPAEADVSQFFIDMMTGGHFLKEGSVNQAWGKNFANKALTTVSNLMQFKPYDASKDFFGDGRLNIGICNFPFSNLGNIEKQCKNTADGIRHYPNGCGWICSGDGNTFGYQDKEGGPCTPWKTYTCPVEKESIPNTSSCDFIKPYTKDLKMGGGNSPANQVQPDFQSLGLAFDCDSIMSFWMGDQRTFSGRMSFLNKGFDGIADMFEKELNDKRKIPAGEAFNKNFIPSSIEFWKHMLTSAAAGKAPTEFEGYSFAEFMFNNMMISKCDIDDSRIQYYLRIKDQTECSGARALQDEGFAQRCGSKLVDLNGSPFAKACQLPTFSSSQTQQLNFKGLKGLPSTCSLAGGNSCSFQMDLTTLMGGKRATARMWMKTCPSGLPSMYMDIVGSGTAPLQKPVGDFCNPKAQANTCGEMYQCQEMEDNKFLASMAYSNSRKYIKCTSNSDCTPFSWTKDVNVFGIGFRKFDAKCDTQQGFCIWDGVDVNLRGTEAVATQTLIEEKNGKPVRDDSFYGLLQTIFGKPVEKPPADKLGICIGIGLKGDEWSKEAIKQEQDKVWTFNGMSDWTPRSGVPPPTQKPTEKYTGSPTKVGGTGAPTTMRPTPKEERPTPKEDSGNSGSALHPGFVGLAAAVIVLAF
jgi:hypothetical protein